MTERTIIATVRAHTVTARLISDGWGLPFIEITGANRWIPCADYTDSSTRAAKRDEWRAEIRDRLIAAGADEHDVWSADWKMA